MAKTLTHRRGSVVTRRELAELLGVHMQTVTRWEQAGLPIAVRGRRGKPSLYRLSAVRAWLRTRDAQSEVTASLSPAYHAARVRLQEVNARLLELRFHEKANQLVSRPELEALLHNVIADCRTRIRRLPRAIQARCARVTDRDVAVLDTLVDEVLEELNEESLKAQW
jgi:phage terminase Nu1 subunit (DNA packaging protein)